MFPYFGCKTRIAHLYPAPAQGRVIEPFAGSARYALLYREHDVWINDIDPLIYRIWKYIQQASRKDIESLPELGQGEDLRRFKWLSDEERALLGFCLNFQQVRPKHVCTEWAARKRTCRLLKRRLLDNLNYVRDWKITCLHYADLPDVEATWFVDPPYQHSRCRYRYHCVADYHRLARWCRTRNGQVIVCEGLGADWLPFRRFTRQQAGTGDYFEEVIWTRTG
jgi:site-specific DNA-adenine methylase